MVTQSIETPADNVPAAQPPVVDLSIAEDAIKDMADRYLTLTVKGINDKVGIAACHKARMVCKRKRVEIEKKRKELNAEPQNFINTVNGTAKRLTALLVPIEHHLEQAEAIVENEKKRIAAEEAERRQKMIIARLQCLQAVGEVALEADVANLTPPEWEAKIRAARDAKHQRDEADRVARADSERLATALAEQAAQLAADRAEFDRQRDQQAAIDAERRRLEDELAAKQRERETLNYHGVPTNRTEAAAATSKAVAEARDAVGQLADTLAAKEKSLLAIAEAVDDIRVAAIAANTIQPDGRVAGILTKAACDICAVAGSIAKR